MPNVSFLILIGSCWVEQVDIDSKKEGQIKYINLEGCISSSLFLFVYDVMLFGVEEVNEVKNHKDGIDLCCREMRMEVNLHRSSILCNEVEDNPENQIPQVIPYSSTLLIKGIKYIGSCLKPKS